MEEVEQKINFIDLGVAYLRMEAIAGIAKADIAANPTHEAMFVNYIYLVSQNQPIAVPYDTAEARDSAYESIKQVLA